MTMSSPLNPMDFPLFGTRLIEASAGTGKTYTIAALYLRLILGHGRCLTANKDLLPPDILVVTFTEAATKELRERIRERLNQSARFFRQQAVESDVFLDTLRADYVESDWPACARRLEIAANWMDEAAIYTIHGWCNRMLVQHAFDSGSLFRQEVNTDDTELLNEVVRDYWRTFFYVISETQCRAILQLAQSPDALALFLKPLLAESDLSGLAVNDDLDAVLTAWENWELKRIALETEARQLWLEAVDDIESCLNTAVTEGWLSGVKYRKDTFAAKLQDIAVWANTGFHLPIDAIAKFSKQTLVAALVKKHQNKTGIFVQPAFEAIDKLIEQTQEEVDIYDCIIRHALNWIHSRYDAEKQRLARMTFDDMLTRLDKALRHEKGERLSAVIRQQFPVALIDEFQDTDPVQYRILSTLYPLTATSDQNFGCFMIGDPKQAIYSFRGADIFTFLKAHRATAGRHYTLLTNYRSSADLVQAVNQVFLSAERQEKGAFRFKTEANNPLQFISVDACGRKEDWFCNGQKGTALTIWHWQASEAISQAIYHEQLAEVTASEIVTLLQYAQSGKAGFRDSKGKFSPLEPGDIAILVRSRIEAKVMRAALNSRRLNCVYLSERDSIFATLEATDLLCWLHAMAEPRNELKVRSAMATFTFGWSYQTIQKLGMDEIVWEQHLERFLGYQQRWQQDGILPALRQLLHDYTIPARLAAEAGGERCVTNLLHLAELLQQASSKLEGELALIRYFTESIASQGDQAHDESIIRLESDANLIKIVTVHKSKGLEYPLVFLPFICSFREVNNGKTTHYRYHDQQQNLVIDLSKDESIRLLVDEERLQEDVRLLYVALTRARYACWLGIAPIKSGNTKDCQLEKSAMGSLLGWQVGMPVAALAGKLMQLKGDCATIDITTLPSVKKEVFRDSQRQVSFDATRRCTARVSTNWWITSYSALATNAVYANKTNMFDQSEEPETAQEDKRVDEAEFNGLPGTMVKSGIHSLPGGAEAGVLIHELFEQCAIQGFSRVQADLNLANELIQSCFASKDWLNKHQLITSALSHWLTMPLMADYGLSLAQLSPDTYQAEMEFLIGTDSVDVGALDKLVTTHFFAGYPRPALLSNQLNGLLKGFIDLVFTHKHQYYVVDYKFNYLGNSDDSYTMEAVLSAMLTKRYDLQAAIYLLALHRLLKIKLGDVYNYDTHIGGGLYIFLRGYHGPCNGQVFNKPSSIFIEQMDALFSGITGTTSSL